MYWTDDAVVLGARRHGESALIVELMTRAHGRHLGLVHGGRSPRLSAVLQAGNGVQATWRARLDEHLGTYTVEAQRSRAAALIASPRALHGLSALAGLLRLLPERDPHPGLYERAVVLLDHLGEDLAPALFVRFELALLADLGFGLDLSACAATGAEEGLAFVSPKSGRAVGAEAGAPYRDKLLPLPRFLVDDSLLAPADPAEVAAGFRLTGYFLERHVFGPQGLAPPDARARFVALAGG
ncbi:MAG TPA: DNA repair protein RecO [Beijerinckiaceae bacterium]|nr:DNA repair protein RecO [Beijerinckiaceae bacterium]